MSARQAPHPIEAMCLGHRMCLYWSARHRTWCHMDGWPCRRPEPELTLFEVAHG